MLEWRAAILRLLSPRRQPSDISKIGLGESGFVLHIPPVYMTRAATAVPGFLLI